jgi:hypothetical protein
LTRLIRLLTVFLFMGGVAHAQPVPGSPAGASGGTSSNFGASFPTAGTASGFVFGGNLTGASTDGVNGNLDVNCVVGCAGGTASNASSGVATSSTNGKTNAWLYGFNGTTWDQLQVDGSKNLKVLATGSGSAGTAASGVLTVQGIASMTPVQVSQATAGNLNATVVQSTAANLLANVGGLAASGASVSGNPILNGGRAQNAEQTAVTNGQAVGLASDLVGRLIVSPYANKENFVGGTVSVTGTSSTSLVAAPGASLYLYITAVSCFNSGSTLTTVLFQNGSGGTTIWEGVAAPTGGGFTHTFPVPIGGVNNMTANTALYIQAGSATTTLYCNASGYKGT